MLAHRFADAAIELVGTPFRLNGRDRGTGVDCVGLVVCALEETGIAATPPTGYRLRQGSVDRMLATVPDAFDDVSGDAEKAGDLALLRTGPMQHHLCVIAHASDFVHAHAGLRKVVRQRGPIPWPIIRIWRLNGAV